jgi:radical SAM protein with 4Fe4S-binding SPASM domain
MEDIDNHKLMYHPRRVAEWIEKGDCAPISVEVGLINLCNHKCIFCGLDWARGKEILPTSLILDNLQDMARLGVKSVCFSGAGEPLLHPDFPLIVKKAREFGLDISMSTNAVLFSKEKAEQILPHLAWIRFSVDAATPETHSKIHGTSNADFEKLLNNIKDAVKIKKDNNYPVVLGAQFLLLEDNSSDALEFAKIFKDVGVDNVQIKPYSHNPDSLNDLSIDYNKYLPLKDSLTQLSSPVFKVFFRINAMQNLSDQTSYPECFGLPFSAVINEKGEVQPCVRYYAQKDFSYGNIYEKKFSDIWNSPLRKEIMEKIKKHGVHNCRKSCRLDVINRYLDRIKNPLEHDNFI